MKVLKWVFKKTLLNWQQPFYSSALYEFSKRYLDLWFGDNNFDRRTNGEYRLLRALLPTCTTMFDVGANVGDYAGEALAINPRLTIHAFEPDPDAYIKLRALPLVANNLALGVAEEAGTLYRSGPSTHNSVYAFAPGAEPLKISITTMDTYAKKNTLIS